MTRDARGGPLVTLDPRFRADAGGAALAEQPADEREERPHREEEAERLTETVAEILHAGSVAWRRRTRNWRSASARGPTSPCAAWTGWSGRPAASAGPRIAPRPPTVEAAVRRRRPTASPRRRARRSGVRGAGGGGFARRLHAREPLRYGFRARRRERVAGRNGFGAAGRCDMGRCRPRARRVRERGHMEIHPGRRHTDVSVAGAARQDRMDIGAGLHPPEKRRSSRTAPCGKRIR